MPRDAKAFQLSTGESPEGPAFDALNTFEHGPCSKFLFQQGLTAVRRRMAECDAPKNLDEMVGALPARCGESAI